MREGIGACGFFTFLKLHPALKSWLKLAIHLAALIEALVSETAFAAGMKAA